MSKRKRVEAEAEVEAQDESLAATDAPQATASAAEPSSKRIAQRRSLFVRSLPATTTTESLIEFFSESLPVKHATAVIDRETKQCKGYGFVTFADAEDAQRALKEFRNAAFEGRKLKIEIAEPRHREVEDAIPGVERPVSKPTGPVTKPTGRVAEAEKRREQDKSDGLAPPRIIVRNLPWSIKKPEELAKLFRSYGKVKKADLPQKKPGLLSGFGFVLLRGRKNAEKAIEGLNGKEVDGRTIAVDWAVDKTTWNKHVEEEEQQDVNKRHNADDGVDSDPSSTEPSSDESSDEDSDEDFADDDLNGNIEPAAPDGERDTATDEEDDDRSQNRPPQDFSATIFVRNLPWTSTDESFREHFEQFGAVRYARIVMDRETERPKGTGFVCFFSSDDARKCLQEAPRTASDPGNGKGKSDSTGSHHRSVLQNDDTDLTGQYTMEGRVLQLSHAVEREQANRLNEAGMAHRENRDKDKRKLYLLSEGTIPAGSALHQVLSPSEIAMREASFKQRRTLITSNPSLHLSLTRLAVRNVPRSVTSKDLKELARKAVAGFAEDVKNNKRERLSKEELARGGEDMVKAEKARKAKGKGVVKQAKIVFEGKDGSKIDEKSGGGQSRGYGFVEYHTHRLALMALRWLNGHAIDYQATLQKKGKANKEETEDRKKRLIVEFAIENAQVVARRRERESKAKDVRHSRNDRAADDGQDKENGPKDRGRKGKTAVGKGRRDKEGKAVKERSNETNSGGTSRPSAKDDEKMALRQKIIARKRATRRDKRNAARKGRG